jgi:Flp pilus assembly protein TadD/SAM-dependent methyltransferase
MIDADFNPQAAAALCLLGRPHEAARDWGEGLSRREQADRWAGVSDHLRDQGQFAAAAQAAARSVACDETCARGWTAAALAALNRGDVNSALHASARAMRADGANPEALRAGMLASLAAGNIERAEVLCDAAAKSAPERPEAIAAQALIYMMRGDHVGAERCFRAAIEASPGAAEPIGNLAALLSAQGRHASARLAGRRAIALKPFLPGPYAVLGRLPDQTAGEGAGYLRRAAACAAGRPDVLTDLADLRTRDGDFNGAATAARAGLCRSPTSPELWTNLGVALHRSGMETSAATAYHRALIISPGMPEAVNNVARLHQECGRLVEAAACLRDATQRRPHDGELRRNLISALIGAGLSDEAAPLVAAAVQASPDDPDTLLSLGRLLCRIGRFDEAEAAFRQALRHDRTAIVAALQAAGVLLEHDRPQRAVAFARHGVRLAPRDARGWALLAATLRACADALPDDPTLIDDVVVAFAQPGAEPANLAAPASALAMRSPAMITLDTAARSPTAVEETTAALRRGDLDNIAKDSLLAVLLCGASITDHRLERALTLLRRVLLTVACEDPDAPPLAAWGVFLCALAQQCFLNEYVFDEEPDETAAVDALERRLRAEIDGGALPLLLLSIYAAYRPLRRLERNGAVMAAAASLDFARLVERQIAEPEREEVLKRDIPRLTPIDDPISRLVQAQYEDNPYPRWRSAGLFDTPASVHRVLRAILPYAELPEGDARKPNVLVAGCGSGREAVWAANQFAGARVLALDLSRASLAFAARQTEKLGIANVEFAQADILRLGDFDGRRFDMIHCVGVLHHTSDANKGLEILRGLLTPNGVMKLGFYSAAARRAVVAAHALISADGAPAAFSELRPVRRILRNLPEDHPAAACARSPDFFTASACRDLLFHAHEKNVDLPELATMLDRAGLRLLGFQFDEPSIAVRYRNLFPSDPAMTRFDLLDRFEATFPDTFAGLYQFWVARKL